MKAGRDKSGRRSRLRYINRRSVPLFVAVFLIGAGIGAAVIAVTRHHHRQTVVVEHVVMTATAVTTAGAPSSRRSSTAKTVDPAQTKPASHRPTEGATDQAQSTIPPGARASFAALQSRIGGSVGLAVAPLGAGPLEAFGDAQSAPAWSTSKVPVLSALLYTDEQQNRELDAAGRLDATNAITESDNASIEALFSSLEALTGGLVPASDVLQQLLRESGDETTRVNTAPNDSGYTTYGQTLWPVTGEVKFYRALARGCLLNPADTSYVLGLMRQVVPSERWGAGSAGFPASVSLAFKGGWGPNPSGAYQVRQTAIVGGGDRGYVVSMLALPASGSFAGGTQMITALATWARQHLRLNARRPPSTCGSEQ